MNRINTHFTRLFALLLLGSTALLSGCADGPGNGTTTSGTPSGGESTGSSGGGSGGTTGASGGGTGGATTGSSGGGSSGGSSGGTTGNTGGNGSCTNAATCPVVTVLLDGKANESLADISSASHATWSSTNTDATTGAKPCTPSGGLGTSTDPWTHSGPFAASNVVQFPAGLTEQPVQNGVYTFVLTCINTTGDGASAGTATLTVGNGTTNPSPINVTVTATPPTINLGGSSAISWSAVDANGSTDSSITCVHTSKPVDPIWNAAPPTASGTVQVTPTSAVLYVYVLTCRNAASGSGSGAAPLNVVDINNPQLVQCPAGQQFTPFRNSTGAGTDVFTASAAIDPLCLGCTVTPNPPVNLVSATNTLGTPAVIKDFVGLLIDGVSITLSDITKTQVPDPILGGPVGFIISRPGAPLLSLDLLNSLRIDTLRDGLVVESSNKNQLLLLDLLGLNSDPALRAVTFNATLPFNSIRLTVGGVADALTATNVYEGGACLAPASASGT